MKLTDDIALLKKACSLIKSEIDGVLWKGIFISLSSYFHIAAIRDGKYQIQNILFRYIIQDIWNIGTIIHRLAWFREKTIKDKSILDIWLPYASVDIEHFHTELRSIMDYSAEIIAHASNREGQIPTSFRKLIHWLSKNSSNRTRIGEDLASVVESADWFFYFSWC